MKKNKNEPQKVEVPCQNPKCIQAGRQLDSLVETLDVERLAKGSLVMWPKTDMRGYAVSVAVAGLLQNEITLSKIRTVLLENQVRPDGDIVDAVRRLGKKRFWKE